LFVYFFNTLTFFLNSGVIVFQACPLTNWKSTLIFWKKYIVLPKLCKTGNTRGEFYNDCIDWLLREYNGKEASLHRGFIVIIMLMKLSSQASSCCESELWSRLVLIRFRCPMISRCQAPINKLLTTANSLGITFNCNKLLQFFNDAPSPVAV